MTNLIPGKRYAYTYEITVRDDGGIPSWIRMLEQSGLPGTPAHIEQLPDPMPQWQVGDVIAWDEQALNLGTSVNGPTVRRTSPCERTAWSWAGTAGAMRSARQSVTQPSNACGIPISASVVAAVSGTFWFVVGIAFGMLIAYIDADSSRKRH